MPEQLTRRGFLGGCGAAGVLALAGCSPRGDDRTDPGGPVTVSHLFGQTTIPEPPRRVVSAGYTGQDDLLAVGVVPIALTDWFGDQPFAVWPWARPRLGAAEPVVLNLDDGIDVGRIGELEPDLIVATNAGLDAETYQRLSAIAPTIAQSGGAAFFEPWKEQATAIGRAVHQGDRMRSAIDDVERRFADVASAHPQFNGKNVLLLSGRLDRGRVVSATGWRTEFLARMGLVVAGAPAAIDRDQIESALGSVDVLIWTTESDDEQQALIADPAIAAAADRSVFTSTEQAAAIAFASPLSYPLVTDQLPARIAEVL